MVREALLDIFYARCKDARLNTSYPLSPSDWVRYRAAGPLPFNEKTLSFYVHIPFCRRLCSFCEYTRTICPNSRLQEQYINTLRNDIFLWIDGHQDIELKGFDFGGGTPTSLDNEAFRHLMDLYYKVISSTTIANGFEPSIEGTFQTLNEKKLRAISEAGIKRISLGLQAANDKVLRKASRDYLSLEEAKSIRRLVRESGIQKLNVDLMYGLNGKTVEDGLLDLRWIEELAPEQVALYEFRPNMLTGKNFADADERYDQYRLLYNGLIKLGYYGEFGSNAFSLDKEDLGLSSYLRTRMRDGVAYKGFGLSAQSMSSHGISYNMGKGAQHLESLLEANSFSEEYTYFLPRTELLAKYVSISAYYGRFSTHTASRILGKNYLETKDDILRFLQEEELVTMSSDQVTITKKGFRHFGAVFSLLGSDSL